MSNKVKTSYNHGECPDCGLVIPDDIVDGQACEVCGHIFREELPCLRWRSVDPGVAKGHIRWVCVNDHTSCIWNNGHNTCSHSGDSVTPLVLSVK